MIAGASQFMGNQRASSADGSEVSPLHRNVFYKQSVFPTSGSLACNTGKVSPDLTQAQKSQDKQHYDDGTYNPDY